MEGLESEVLPFKIDFQFDRPWSRKFSPMIEAPPGAGAVVSSLEQHVCSDSRRIG